MSRMLWPCLLVASVLSMPAAVAYDEHGRPGDYGYRHRQYHEQGVIDELRRKAGASCCDGLGECRATFADLAARTVYLDGNWCPIGAAIVRRDVALPDDFALVCAGPSAGPLYPCPVVYCVAVPAPPS